MNKKTTTLLIWLALTAVCFGQAEWVWEAMPWLPLHKTNHLRSLRTYIPSDSIMGARRLERTFYYDRHGYETADSIRLTYDDEGRLVQRLVVAPRMDAYGKDCDTLVRQRIYYSPEGLVGYYAEESFTRWGGKLERDTTTEIYQLVSHRQNTQQGVTECLYRRTYSDPGNGLLIIDSCGCLREYDSLGRLTRQRVWQMNYDFVEETWHYGADGRLLYDLFDWGDWKDSTAYQYNHLGELIGKSGKMYVDETMSEHFASCRPDGTTILETTIEYSYDPDLEDYDMTLGRTIRRHYDKHGTLIRREDPLQLQPVVEYDPEYWNE